MFLANGRVTAHAAEISGHERIRCRACAWHSSYLACFETD